MSVEKALFGNSSYQLLRGALDAAALRQKVIADNVANSETPGFRPHEVAFEEHLGAALGTSAPPLMLAGSSGRSLSLPGGTSGIPRPEVVESPAPDGRNGADPGDFDMERSMAELNENRVQYATVAQLLSNRLIGLKNAIESR